MYGIRGGKYLREGYLRYFPSRIFKIFSILWSFLSDSKPRHVIVQKQRWSTEGQDSHFWLPPLEQAICCPVLWAIFFMWHWSGHIVLFYDGLCWSYIKVVFLVFFFMGLLRDTLNTSLQNLMLSHLSGCLLSCSFGLDI